VLDIYPAPPPEAQWIDFTFHGGGYRYVYVNDAGRRFVLRAPLPLPAVTFDESLSKMGISQAQLVSGMQAAQQLRQSLPDIGTDQRQRRGVSLKQDWLSADFFRVRGRLFEGGCL
jgi:hypothetical protein